MKASHSLTAAITVIALARGFAPSSLAQTAIVVPPPEPHLAQSVYLASLDAEDRSLRRYAGQKLYNAEGAELGSVRDFIVHPSSGRVHSLVVSTGGFLGGIGNHLRLVPFEVVRRGSRGNLFEVDILQASWLQIPPFNDKDYVVDRFYITSAQHQEMARRFGGMYHPPFASSPSEPGPIGLIRASTLRGKGVVVGDRLVGNIENIIFDLERGTVAALFDASGEFTGTRAKYLIPLNRLVYNDVRQDPLSTSLTREDFDRALPDTFGPIATVAVTAPPAPPPVEPPLPPTGRPTAIVIADPASDPLVASARAIRQAFNNDSVLVAENVQVSVESGRIILRGTVRNEATRTALDNMARRSTASGPIDNQIVVVHR